MNEGRTARPRRGLLIGAGYFSDFHLDAWQRLPGAEIVCVCDLDESKARRTAERYGIAAFETDLSRALQREDLDFVDIATPPQGRLELVQQLVPRGLPMICQKPLGPDFASARQIIALADDSTAPFMVHENFRFQPWYREIARLLREGVIGSRLHTITMRSRMGDGWGDDAYQARQPYFRTMPRLLVHETGVHFIDTFRMLVGERVVECSATLTRWNQAIAGEDAGIVQLRFAGGAIATWDANRYNESLADDPRYTFGDLVVEADGGSLWLNADGQITVKRLGQPAYCHAYDPPRIGFAGDCVRACQQHFLDVLDGTVACETSPQEYLKTLRIVEAIYDADRMRRSVQLDDAALPQRRVVDLSLPVSPAMPGVEIAPAKTLEADGWNATTLSFYSHAGTHIDAPKHFLTGGGSLDELDLAVCCGPARLIHLVPIKPRQAITINDCGAQLASVQSGDRLLFRTDWSKRVGTAAYRDELPRISLELARWLVDRRVALIGVEPPSVADVNNRSELTEVHQTLFRGGVVIVEGLANLDQIRSPQFEFVAVPLRIVGGDGCPVRAIAIEHGMGQS